MSKIKGYFEMSKIKGQIPEVLEDAAREARAAAHERVDAIYYMVMHDMNTDAQKGELTEQQIEEYLETIREVI